ncbi:MAG: helix-turn-helix domain-containing protein [Eggerthellaceae bacterium]|nr:helix-turn-helix domain-containing protein [Eggerthellaceae bacterium]
MKLSMSMIEAYLEKYRVQSEIQSDARSIKGMRFLAGRQDKLSTEYVHIGAAAGFIRDPRYADAVILASGRSHILCQGPTQEELLNEVLSAFDFYGDIEHRLMEAAAQRVTVAEMAEIAGEMLRDPLLVFGLDGSYLGGSHLDSVPDAHARRAISSRRGFVEDIMGSKIVDEAGNPVHDLTARPQVTHGPRGETAVCAYLVIDREPIGFVMCFPESESHVKLALCVESFLLDYFPQAYEFVDLSSPHQSVRYAVQSLLKGEDVTEETRRRLLETLGNPDKYQVLLVRSLSVRNRTQSALLAREVMASSIPCVAADMDDMTAIIVAEERTWLLVSRSLPLSKAPHAAIGVSMPAADFGQAPVAYRQAKFACDSTDQPEVRYCRDLAFPFLLNALRSDPSAGDLLHPALMVLESYDAGKHSDLLTTLKAYVASGFNQVETAKRLHVHLNTLKYRLKRISELTGLDWGNAREMLYLQLSIELCEPR